MSKIYDLSIPLQPGMPAWPGDNVPLIEQYASIAEGEMFNGTRIQFSVHTGTHVDAPRHVVDAAPTIDEIPLETLIGPAEVIHLPDADRIDADTLAGYDWLGCQRVLFKTRNSEYWREPVHPFRTDFVSLTLDGAEFLLNKGIKLFGVDYLSIDEYSNNNLEVHHLLLGHNIIAIEGLNLLDVPAGSYELICLPLKIVNADGAPARVVLREGQ